MPAFVGRSAPLARLTATYQALAAPPGLALSPWARLVLVTGEAGIGKTAVVTRFASQVIADGGTVVWGSCWDGDQAPAWWPWTQALRTLVARSSHLTEAARPELAAILPEVATNPTMAETDAASLLRVFEAAGHLLSRAAADAPVMVVLDDLHWADRSTVDLVRHLAHRPQSSGLMIVAAYRPNELAPDVAGAVADVASAADLIPLSGLPAGEVADLVQAVAGNEAPPHWAGLVHERSGGHPFYARELCRLLAATGTATDVPAAVREVIRHRLARLSGACAGLLDAAAVSGTALLPDVLAEVIGDDTTAINALAAEATAAGILAAVDNRAAFVHDLYRETIYTSLPPERRLDLHHRVATALLHRHQRGTPVFAGELAHHFTAAVQTAGTAPAVTWLWPRRKPTPRGARSWMRPVTSPSYGRHSPPPARRWPTPMRSVCSPPKQICCCGPATPNTHGRCSTPRGFAPPAPASPILSAAWHSAWTASTPDSPCRAPTSSPHSPPPTRR